MEDSPLISVLLPTYNVEQYVEQAINSILYQTYSNLELIVVDDCSSDRTFDYVLRIAQHDSRVRAFRNERNLKISRTLNFALSCASGDLIARMDGDDISHPKRLEKLQQFLLSHPDIDLVGSLSEAIDENGKHLAFRKLPLTPRGIHRTLPLCSTVQHIWLAKRELYEELGGYRECPGAEDYDFLLRADSHGHRLANYPEYLYQVRLRRGNTESSEGLNRVLTKQYVYRANRNGFNIDLPTLQASIKIGDKQKDKYRKASNRLNKAKHERDKPLKMIADTLLAAFTSVHMTRYLIEVTLVRLACKVEVNDEI